MSKILVALAVVGSILAAAPVQGADPVRILLFENAGAIILSADGGLVVELQNGRERWLATPVTVEPGGNGIRLNGNSLGSEVLSFRGRRQDLSVSFRPGQNGAAPEARAALESSVASPAMPPSPPLVVGGLLHVKQRGLGLAGINAVDLEDYVKGVVPAEMNSGWHLEALKVQAVAARTYVVYQRMMNGGRDYDVLATAQDQVYQGRRGVDQRIHEAVEATRDLVLTYQDVPILAAFSSTAAGPTEDAINVWSKDLPYLKGVECPFDRNSPHFEWQASFTLEDLEAALQSQGRPVGTIASFTPYAYSRAGRVTKIRVLHSHGELILRGEELRRAVGYQVIRSTQFEIDSVGREVLLSGRGAGHAVGLCQWGTKELAELGYSFHSILYYYFPGTILQPLYRTRLVFSAAR